MRVAFIGSDSFYTDMSDYLPGESDELVFSKDMMGLLPIKKYADIDRIPSIVLDSGRYGLSPIDGARLVAQISDKIVAVWNGEPGNVDDCVQYARILGKPVMTLLVKKQT